MLSGAQSSDGEPIPAPPQAKAARTAGQVFDALARLHGVSINDPKDAAVRALGKAHADAMFSVMHHTDRQLAHSREQQELAKRRLEVLTVALDAASNLRSLVYKALEAPSYALHAEKVRKGSRRAKEIEAQLAALHALRVEAEKHYGRIYDNAFKPSGAPPK
jgi:hypothetical protein